MQLLPECLDALQYRTFWETIEKPTLLDFLNFRLSIGTLDDKRIEYTRYNNELSTISRFYAEASEFGQKIISWKTAFKETILNELLWDPSRSQRNDKKSRAISDFWYLQDANSQAEEIEQSSKAEIRMLQAAQHVTIAKVATQQVQQYARSTTTSIAKRFIDNNEESTKRVKTHKSDSEKNDNDYNTDETNYDGKKSTTNEIEKQKHTDKSVIDGDGFRTPPHQIVGNTYFPSSFQSMILPNENILKVSPTSLAALNDSKYFKDFIPRFLEFKELEKNNEYSCTHDDIMDIRGDSDFAKFLSFDEYRRLLSVKPNRNIELPKSWCEIIEEYYKEMTEHGLKRQIFDWINVTKELIFVKNEDTEESIKLKEYLYHVMLPLIQSFRKPIPDISAANTSERHYWSEFGHRFFSKMLQDFVGLDWRTMEVPVMASKYRKNYGLNYAKDKIVEGKSADLLAWLWETGEEIFVGEQAGPPSRHDLTKLSMDSFKLYRELRDCRNVRILYSIEKGDFNYSKRTVFGILGYLFEIKMVIMWRDGVYIYEEFGSLKIPSHPDRIFMMKPGMLRLLEFMSEVQSTLNVEYNNDAIQLLKRKFNDIIQTKPSPTK
ncbi:28678_t:CDS:10, partial [Gigaspora margarita]